MDASNDLFGRALTQYYFNEDPDKLWAESNISRWDEYPLDHLLRSPSAFPKIEQEAIALVRGAILDLGCGAGSHSLVLQNMGHDVTAIDQSPGAVKVALDRGVQRVYCQRILDFQNASFDTILMLMNGTGIFETLERVPTYLNHLKCLLKPKGSVLLDSSDLRYMYDSGPNGTLWVPADRYYGELKYRLKYKEEKGPWFSWLFLDYNRLALLAQSNGWHCEMVAQGPHHDYLARLRPNE